MSFVVVVSDRSCAQALLIDIHIENAESISCVPTKSFKEERRIVNPVMCPHLTGTQ